MKKTIKKTKTIHLCKHQYIYESKKGKISLIPPCYGTMDRWEAMGIGDKSLGEISEDPERFSSQDKAEEFINKIL